MKKTIKYPQYYIYSHEGAPLEIWKIEKPKKIYWESLNEEEWGIALDDEEYIKNYPGMRMITLAEAALII